jgi:hypothetical protein
MRYCMGRGGKSVTCGVSAVLSTSLTGESESAEASSSSSHGRIVNASDVVFDETKIASKRFPTLPETEVLKSLLPNIELNESHPSEREATERQINGEEATTVELIAGETTVEPIAGETIVEPIGGETTVQPIVGEREATRSAPTARRSGRLRGMTRVTAAGASAEPVNQLATGEPCLYITPGNGGKPFIRS